MLIDLALRADEEIEAGYTMFERIGDRVIAEGSVSMLKGCPHLWGTARALRDSHGRIVGAIESIRDVTERKRSEKAVHESDERFNLFMDHFPGVVFTKDSHGRYLYVNRFYEEHRGRRREDSCGRTDHDIWPREDAVRFLGADQQVMREGRCMEILETIKYADGQDHIQKTIKFPLLKDGRPAFLGGHRPGYQ